MSFDIVTIDLETYYTREYSLSRITTEEYVRSPLFEAIGVSVKMNGALADWYSGPDIKGFLRSLDYSKCAILCHNTAFDGAILSWRYGIKPRLWLDTMSMAAPLHKLTVGCSLAALSRHYGLGEKGTEVIAAMGKRRADFMSRELAQYGRYCCNDSDLTYKLFKKLVQRTPPEELRLIDQILRMYTEPRIMLDKKALKAHLSNVLRSKQALLDALGGDTLKVRKLLASNLKFAELLRRAGAEPPTKISPATGKETYAFAKTDEGFKALGSHPSVIVQSLVAARMGIKSTIEETRTQRLIDVAGRGALPIMLIHYGAHTGRFSGGDKLNLQNLPSREGNAIRKALCAPKGHKLIACDSAQIEARVLALVAGQTDLVDSFRAGRDVYSEFASELYGYPVSKATKKERDVGKFTILGCGYGMGAETYRVRLLAAAGIAMAIEESGETVGTYRRRYHRIPRLWRECGAALKVMVAGGSGVIAGRFRFSAEGIELPNGCMLRYPDLQLIDGEFMYRSTPRSKGPTRKLYGAKVVENLIQALARIVITDQMLAAGGHMPIILQVHDEIITMAPDAQVAATTKKLEQIMSIPPKWMPELPIACESNSGLNYGDCK